MAAPITHIVLSERIFNTHFKEKKEKEFYIATVLPDIRYLKVIDRKKTHFSKVKISTIKKESSFNAGLKFHSLLDKAREEFIQENNTYDYCPNSQYKVEALKIMEDTLLYDKVKDWQKYINFLNQVLPQELELKIKKSALKRWHLLLQEYFLQKPNARTRKKFMGELNFKASIINELNKTAQKMLNNKVLTAKVLRLYKNFNKIIINS